MKSSFDDKTNYHPAKYDILNISLFPLEIVLRLIGTWNILVLTYETSAWFHPAGKEKCWRG
jgi:hypothetical protein